MNQLVCDCHSVNVCILSIFSILKPQLSALALLFCAALPAGAQETRIDVDASQPLHRLSRYLTGACIEDVNHEVYGGIDSQMIFGESFAEPAPPAPLKDFMAFGGQWTPAADGSLHAAAGNGPKLIWTSPSFSNGEVSVDLLFPEKGGGNAGLILKVSQPGKGHDDFNGYEVSLEPAGNLVLGRHRQNWEPIRRVPCVVPINEWITLAVRMTAKSLEAFVNGKSITKYDETEHPLETGRIGLRTWQREARFRNLTIDANGKRKIPFEFAAAKAWDSGVSGMWRAIRRSAASSMFALETTNPFSGRQSQHITFTGGAGEIGIENQSLNRWGMNFVAGKPYEGFIGVCASPSDEIFVALESRDGNKVYAEKKLKASESGWQRLDFSLTPDHADNHGQFAIKLKRPGSILVGYAFLQPGKRGRYKELPVRKDVAEALVDQGITVLRQGGSMVNAAEYRWKKMIGPREHRPPYDGTWYPYASNGWGIFEFLNFCETAGIVGIPDVNADESPQDMADFIEYANGSLGSEWGRRRAVDGHKNPYSLRYLEIGNEERVNEDYWQKFKAIAEAIWANDPHIILVVGDFAYGRKIEDPFHFTGAAGRITSLVAHQKILQLAKQHDREVWFDVHIGTEGPRPDFGGTFSYIDALDRIADGAKHRVVIFEFNANNHSHRRALANAAAINAIERDGRLPIATSANCLQPDGQNDNGWNQGLLFLNPSQAWLQSPGYVTRMVSRNYQPLALRCDVQQSRNNLDVSAKRSEDGKTLVLQVVNFSNEPQPATIHFNGFIPSSSTAHVEELSGPLDATNTAQAPNQITLHQTEWRHQFADGNVRYTFPARSFVVVRFD
jgi:hypothetical protein